jgi:hypothetical protein
MKQEAEELLGLGLLWLVCKSCDTHFKFIFNATHTSFLRCPNAKQMLDRVEEGEAGGNAQVASRAMNKTEPDFALLSGFECPRLTFPGKAFINLDATHCKSSQNPTFHLPSAHVYRKAAPV